MKDIRKILDGQFRWTVMVALAVFLLVLCSLAVTGCSDDDEPMPAYISMLGEFRTNGNGEAAKLRDDDGKEWPLNTVVRGLTPDSVYRVQAIATKDETESGLTLYHVESVASPMPRTIDADKMKRDVVTVITAWRSDRYVKLRQSEGCSNEKSHYMAFRDLGVRENPDGVKIMNIELMHDNNGDYAYYQQEVLVSCPTYQMTDLQQGRDSVCMTVRTNEGMRDYRFLY